MYAFTVVPWAPNLSAFRRVSSNLERALTERDFVEKLEKAGFGEIQVHHREAVSVDDLALYPLFTGELIQLMRTLLPSDRQEAVATSVVITARRM